MLTPEPSSCPKCSAQNIYPDGSGLWTCPDCTHEWNPDQVLENVHNDDLIGEMRVVDANGTPLQDGDSVSIIKDLKVKGASNALKVGTKVKNIRLVDSSDGHNISCKIDGFGAMNLKSEFVKKV